MNSQIILNGTISIFESVRMRAKRLFDALAALWWSVALLLCTTYTGMDQKSDEISANLFIWMTFLQHVHCAVIYFFFHLI